MLGTNSIRIVTITVAILLLELKYCVSNVKKTSKQCKRYKTKHRYLTDNYRIIHSKKNTDWGI